MFLACHFYSSIVKAVFQHERNLRAQAKKMNVDSLRSNNQGDVENAEFKVAKVAITAVVLWLCNWVPYAILCSLPTFGLVSILTPMVSTIPALLSIYYSHEGRLASLKWPKVPMPWQKAKRPMAILYILERE